jgi:sulfate transport system substrate-binding protein
MKRLIRGPLLCCVLLALLAGCATAAAGGTTVTITLGAFSTPQAVYAKLIPLFQAQWKQQTGQTVNFQQSYAGSGAQSKAIINGFPADVAALATAPDMDAIKHAGLITHDWTATPTHGFVSDSIVAFAVRSGNPKGIHDWADLARPGIQILTPNPATSGGAQWNILALYGAALRGAVPGVARHSPSAALAFLEAVLKNVKVLDKDAQTSITDFENGIGDVAITYESSVLVARNAGKSDQLVIPTASILIQEPIAIVDANVDLHGNRQVAQAFVAYLLAAPAQQFFATDGGLRPVDQTTANAGTGGANGYTPFPAVADLFTIDALGGWSSAKSQFFGPSGIYTQAITAAQQG